MSLPTIFCSQGIAVYEDEDLQVNATEPRCNTQKRYRPRNLHKNSNAASLIVADTL